MSIFSIAFTLFIIMNSIGLVPLILALLRNVEPKVQRRILLREMLVALGIILVFNFLGELFFSWLNIKESNIQMAGGLILFLIAIRMIFPNPKQMSSEEGQELPFIVPIATPLVAGPSLLAAVMFYAKEQDSVLAMLASIFIAWIASTIVFLLAPTLKKFIGDKGLIAFERLMGLLLTLIAVQMFLQGMAGFITHSLPPLAT